MASWFETRGVAALLLRDASLRDAPQSLTENAASIFNALEQLEKDSLFRHGRACPGHPRLSRCWPVKTWMPGTSPGMTSFAKGADFYWPHFQSGSQDEV
jgi:hypothetical protein